MGHSGVKYGGKRAEAPHVKFIVSVFWFQDCDEQW